MKTLKAIVCIDRDGTINKDENYYLGSDPNWKDQVSFLEGVVNGIKFLNMVADTHVFIVTNQSGVALKGGNFDNLTLNRMHEVNRYVIDKLAQEGAHVDGYFACPFVDTDYAIKAREKGRLVDHNFIRNYHPDLKPNTGMIQRAMRQVGVTKDDCLIYTIGDRASDVEMGVRAGGLGFLVEGFKTKELSTDVAKVLKMQNGRTAENFVSAVNTLLVYHAMANTADSDFKLFQ